MSDWTWWPEAWNRLGWVLVHFLWQGAVIGSLAGFTTSLLRKSTAQARYLVLCAALAACGLAPMVTWSVLGQENAAPLALATIQPAHSLGDASRAAAPPTGPQLIPLLATGVTASPAQARLAQILEKALPWLVLAWGIGVFILSLRLIVSWCELRRVGAAGRSVASELWRHRLESLSAQMGITRAVRFIESAQVDVPTVFGWLKPVLIVPAAFFASLPPDQIEAILAHELAHIRRQDYLINLLQLVVETLLFYHPAVWWISRALRHEREICCDDLAVQIVGDRLTYASALAALEETRTVSLAIALAATGGTLLDRVRRVLGQREVRASRQAWFAPLALALILTAIVGAGVYSYAEQAQAESDDPFGKIDFNHGSLDNIERSKMAFRNAVIADKVGLAEAFLRHGLKMPPTDLKSGIGDILSDAAYFTKDPKMIRMLLAHGAKPGGDVHDWRATVNFAFKLGNKEIADMLIAAGAVYDPIWYDAAPRPARRFEKARRAASARCRPNRKRARLRHQRRPGRHLRLAVGQGANTRRRRQREEARRILRPRRAGRPHAVSPPSRADGRQARGRRHESPSQRHRPEPRRRGLPPFREGRRAERRPKVGVAACWVKPPETATWKWSSSCSNTAPTSTPRTAKA